MLVGMGRDSRGWGMRGLAGTCPIFPSNNVWNTPIDSLPVHSSSPAWVASIGANAVMRLDDTLPVNYVSAVQGMSTVVPGDGNSDFGAAPIPANPVMEPGSDGHLLIVDEDNCTLYEMYQASGSGTNWSAGNASQWDLTSNALRPDGWTSADGAGLPMTPGVLRYDEAATGTINHALRMSVPQTDHSYIWPARHRASRVDSAALPPMGARFRLKAGTNISGFSQINKNILKALMTYGVFVADNGLAWAMQHDQDSRWNPSDIVQLHSILGSNWEAVDESGMMTDPNSAAASAPPVLALTPVTPTPVAVTPVATTPTVSAAAPATATSTTSTPQDLIPGVGNTTLLFVAAGLLGLMIFSGRSQQ